MTVAWADEKQAKPRDLQRFLSCKGPQTPFQLLISVEFMFLVVEAQEGYAQGISMLCCEVQLADAPAGPKQVQLDATL